MLDIYIQEDIALHPNWEATSEKYFGVEKNPFDVNISVRKIAGSHVRLQGSDINLYSQLPHISVYELIVNLQKMFNLVFSLDKDSEKLVIEPEVDYYQLNSNTLLDITELVDYDSEISIEPASGSIDYNKISAKYNISDKDFHNSYCLSQYGRAFGEFKTEFESYTKGELSIKNEFTICKAATYIYNDYYTFTASYENENGNLKKVSADKAFVGVRKVHTDTHAETIKLWYNENIHENYNSAQYNILDFCSADFDYSYDTPRAVFTNMEEIPFDNLFFNYYYSVLQEYITLTGKVVTLKAYFDPLTFSSLSKKRIVYWQNNYWKLLKISDWSPKKSVVSVTLLKMIDVEVPKIEKKPVIVSGNWQFGGWIKPLMIDTEHVSVDFLETLGRQGVMISNKAELVNISNVNDSAVAVQELSDILYNRYIQDNVSKYDKVEHKIVECLLDNFTEIEFPDYSYFKGVYLFSVEYIEDFIFQNIIFTGNFKMDNLKMVGDSAFAISNFNEALSLPVCVEIGIRAFASSNFNGALSLPVCERIGDDVFYYSNFSGSLSLPVCVEIGDSAFAKSNFNGALSLPVCEQIGDYAFASSNFSGSLSLPSCTAVGNGAFQLSNFSGSLSLPVCTYIRDAAFYNSNFNSITIGANAKLYTNCIGAHSTEFIQDYADNGKLAGTYVWDEDTQHWIYQ